MTFIAFRRRYESILPVEERPKGMTDKQAVETIVNLLELKSSHIRIGLSQIFFRAGKISQLEQMLEEKTSSIITYFQARCRGYLVRSEKEKLMVSFVCFCGTAH